MEISSTYNHLQQELLEAREKLKGVDENIKRFLGRDPNEPPLTPKTGLKRTANNQLDDPRSRNRTMLPPGRRREFGGHVNDESEPPPNKRRISEGNVFSRLSGPVRSRRERDMDSAGEEDEYGFRPSIQSQVFATPKDEVSRQDVVAAQNADEKSKARNRRMFGALLGTLQKFRQEETRMKDKEEKRAQVELKLEEAARNEREQLRHEKFALFNERKRKQAEIKKIEYKMYRMKEQEEWEEKQMLLVNFIRTKSSPQIFYLPKVHTPRTLQLLEATKDFVSKSIEMKREALQEEMEQVERRGKARQQEKEQGVGDDSRHSWRNKKQEREGRSGRKSQSANMEHHQEEDSDLEGEAGPELDDGGGPGKEGEDETEEGGQMEVKNGEVKSEEVLHSKETVNEVALTMEEENTTQGGQVKKVKSPTADESQSINVDEKEFKPVYD